ncbi:hypothetical protein FRC15_002516 [Serendipita sp. 397]|nr:hypothetical protein FRC15_002516 [Serendipita sp. 397]
MLVPRLSKPPLLPTNASSSRKIPHIRITSTGGRGFRTYAPLRQDSPPPGSPDASSTIDDNAPLTTRLKTLIKSYGLYAIGVYLVLGVVDFSIAFAAINFLGAEQVGKVTTYIKESVKNVLHGSSPDDSPDGHINGKESPSVVGSEGLYAMIVLAYTVHKVVFLPFRAGMTIAFTPRLVRWLRSKGWTGAGGATRAATHVREKLKRGRD